MEEQITTWVLKSTMTISDPQNFKDQIYDGHVFINSKSFIFKPTNSLLSIYKFSFIHIQDTIKKNSSDSLSMKTKMYVEIKRNIRIQEYDFNYRKKDPVNLLFVIEDFEEMSELIHWYEQLVKFQELENQIFDIQYNVILLMLSYNKNKLLSSGVKNKVNEKILMDSQITCRIKPMTQEWFLVQVTEKNIFLREIIWKNSVISTKIKIRDIKRIFLKRYQMKHMAVELSTDKEIFLLNFQDQILRNQFYEIVVSMCKQDIFTSKQIQTLTNEWICRSLSNYEYLLAINELSERSFGDFSQYPVFPWVIMDYQSTLLDLNNEEIYRDLTKPIGAINQERLEQFIEKYQMMPAEDQYFYGCHYSTPGYVTGYLFRKDPLLQLRMQSGKFDAPDRQFHSLQEEWNKCYKHQGCLKELTPEFYGNDTSFLINSKHANFGRRSDGQKINNVVLPLWADSPKDFLKKHREALESDYVSKNINHWIDLIYGYKQQGKKAIENFNVFLKSSYENQINLDKIDDVVEKRAYLTQIVEYGQTPVQIFNQPHPLRNTVFLSLKKEISERSLKNENELLKVLQVKLPQEAKKITMSPKDNLLLYVIDQKLIVHDINSKVIYREVVLPQKVKKLKIIDEKTITFLDRKFFYTFDIELGEVVEKVNPYGDSISAYFVHNQLLFTASQEGDINLFNENKQEITIEQNQDSKTVQLIYNDILISRSELGEIKLFKNASENWKCFSQFTIDDFFICFVKDFIIGIQEDKLLEISFEGEIKKQLILQHGLHYVTVVEDQIFVNCEDKLFKICAKKFSIEKKFIFEEKIHQVAVSDSIYIITKELDLLKFVNQFVEKIIYQNQNNQ